MPIIMRMRWVLNEISNASELVVSGTKVRYKGGGSSPNVFTGVKSARQPIKGHTYPVYFLMTTAGGPTYVIKSPTTG